MKTRFAILLATIAIAFGLVWNAGAQTNTPPTTNAPIISGPAADAWAFITTEGATNWLVAAYGIYSTTSKEWGGGAAIGYKLSDFVVPTMRIDYIGHDFWMPSANLQLQVPVLLFGKVTAIPFTFAGVATTLSGGGNDNGTAIGMLGIGAAVRISGKVDLVADYELWNGGPFHQDNQIRFGALIKFW